MPDNLYVPDDIEERRASYAVLHLGKDDLVPSDFPFLRWNRQNGIYEQSWLWFIGQPLEDVVDSALDDEGYPALQYPLQINAMRTFARKHASVLIGEAPDTSDALVRAECTPIQMPDADEITPEQEKNSRRCERFINLVWEESKGRAIQAENALTTQYLGGSVFKCYYWPDPETISKIRIDSILPDFFLPVWDGTDYWDLMEAYIVYRIPGSVAKEKYGVDAKSNWAIYCEHWTRKTVSIWVDNQPVTVKLGETSFTYDELEHGYGFVPFVYIPRERTGGFYGQGFFPDVEGLTREHNARMADIGDAIRDTVHPDRFLSNMGTQNLRSRTLENGRKYYDLGVSPPGSNKEPKAYREDPPNLSQPLINFTETLWLQMQRMAGVSNIVFGEDEGSQRSALTLAFRMWPTTSQARTTRHYWTIGLNLLAKMVLRIAAQKKLFGITNKNRIGVRIAQNWPPMIPRDREQRVNEVVLLYSAKVISLLNAIERLGDVKDPVGEVDRVWEDTERMLKLQEKYGQKPGDAGDQGGPQTDTNDPVAQAITGDG